MNAFSITLPRQIRFGRGEAAKAAAFVADLGRSGLVVHGAKPERIAWLLRDLAQEGLSISTIAIAQEPDLPALKAALARDLKVDWVLAIGGGSVLDMGKALAALLPAKGDVMCHLEVVGQGLPLEAAPLPFVALPTTAGTGAEATRNAVIALPEQGRKVSLRDSAMLPALAIIDPALSDNSPRAVTLASGLDAITQVIEPYISCKSNLFSDALALPALGQGLGALAQLMQGENAIARDTMAWVSLCGGMALANAGLGAVHGLAGVIGGRFAAPHGAICGILLGPVLAENHAASSGDTRARIEAVFAEIAAQFGGAPQAAPQTMLDWALFNGLPRLGHWGLRAEDLGAIASEAQASSSMKGNPFPLPDAALIRALRAAL